MNAKTRGRLLCLNQSLQITAELEPTKSFKLTRSPNLKISSKEPELVRILHHNRILFRIAEKLQTSKITDESLTRKTIKNILQSFGVVLIMMD